MIYPLSQVCGTEISAVSSWIKGRQWEVLVWFVFHSLIFIWCYNPGLRTKGATEKNQKVQRCKRGPPLFFALWTKVRRDGLQNEGGHPRGSRAEGSPTTGVAEALDCTDTL